MLAEKSAYISSRPLVWTLAGGLLGLGITFLVPDALVPLAPSRLFSLPVALAFGPAWGALSAFLAAGPGAASWMGVAIVLEGIAFGLFARRGWPAWIGAMGLWAIACAAGIRPTGDVGAVPIAVALRAFLSLIVVPSATELLFTIATGRRITGGRQVVPRRPLRAHLFHVFVLAAIVPVLLLYYANSRVVGDRQQADAGERLSEAASAIANDVAGHVRLHSKAVESLAAELRGDGLLAPDGFDQSRVADRLARYGRRYDGFRSLFVLDLKGTQRVGWNVPARRTDPIGEYRDLDFFKGAISSSKVYLGQARQGTRSSQSFVTIAAPLLGPNGRPDWVLAGNLDLERFARFGSDYQAIAGVNITIADRQNRVIYSSTGNVSRLADLSGSPVLVASLQGGRQVFTYTPAADDRDSMLAATTATTDGWRVLVTQPVVNVRVQAEGYYLTAVALLLTAVGLSVLVARVVTQGIGRPLEQLVESMNAFAADTSKPTPVPGIRDDAPLEVAALTRDFENMRTGLVTMTNDLDRKVRERTAELAEAKAKAEDSSRAKSDFLANMSHEIRTPMNGVIGMTELMIGTELNSRQQEYMETVRRSVHSLMTVIDDILDFSTIEADQLSIERRRFILRDRIGLAMRPLTLRANQKALDLTWQVAESVPTHIEGDPIRLMQVLVNLVGNAVKFTEHGTVAIRVDAEPRGDQTSTLHFAVTDTGIGIAPDKLGVIFEAFAQADGSSTRRFGGTGLGLSISAKLVERMNGRMWVESELGTGTTFHFAVPVGATVAPVPAPVVLTDAVEREAPMRILLAEDNPVNQKVAMHLLQKHGHQVVLAEDGEAAVAEFSRNTPDVVLMDVQMPKMSGYEATAAIRKLPGGRDVPIIALTAHAMRGDAEHCLAQGMDAYLSKPVKPAELYRLLAEARAKHPLAAALEGTCR